MPLIALCRGEDPRVQLRELWRQLGIPLMAIAIFLLGVEPGVVTDTDQPGPFPARWRCWEQAGSLWADHKAEREKAAAFYERQDKRNADKLAGDPGAEVSDVASTPASRPTSTRSSPA